jgi:hypothetical protein
VLCLDVAGDPRVGKSGALGLTQQFGRQCKDRMLLDLASHDGDFMEFGEEPGIDVRQLDELLDA